MSKRKRSPDNVSDPIPEYIQKIKCDVLPNTKPFICAVNSCKNSYVNEEQHKLSAYKFHNFPIDPLLRLKWKTLCGINAEANVDNIKICSDHFSPDDYLRNFREEFQQENYKRSLLPEAVPTEKLGRQLPTCAIYGCPNSIFNKSFKVTYFPFPKTAVVAQEWLELTGWPKEKINVEKDHVCSIHFSDTSYQNTNTTTLSYKKLETYAVPTLFLPHIKPNTKNLDESFTKVVVVVEEGKDLILKIKEEIPEEPQANIEETDDKDGFSQTEMKQEMTFEEHELDDYDADTMDSESELPIHIPSDVQMLPNKPEPKKLKLTRKNTTASLLQTYRGLKSALHKQQMTHHTLMEELQDLRQKESDLDQEIDKWRKDTEKEKAKLQQFSPMDILSKVFSPAQIKVLMGNSRITVWSKDDMCVAYAIFQMGSQKFYRYLNQKKVYPLPSRHSLAAWISDYRKLQKNNRVGLRSIDKLVTSRKENNIEKRSKEINMKKQDEKQQQEKENVIQDTNTNTNENENQISLIDGVSEVFDLKNFDGEYETILIVSED